MKTKNWTAAGYKFYNTNDNETVDRMIKHYYHF
jgi:hypothetical protein